jgi:DNA-binding MarR family transcriptional regulator
MAAIDDTDLVHHPHLTTAGLLVEAHAGFTGRLERELLRECELAPQWFDVLMRLYRTPAHRLRMSHLAAQTTLSASGLTRVVDRLEALGLVAREACPTDRRSAYAVLSPEGEARIAAALPVHVAELEAVFDELYTAEEMATLTELLRRLRDQINPCAAAASLPDADHHEPGGG